MAHVGIPIYIVGGVQKARAQRQRAQLYTTPLYGTNGMNGATVGMGFTY
jgi:hypothetical protein